MRFRQTGIICSLIASWSLLGDPVAGADSERIQGLIRSLSADSFQSREEAAGDLWEMGEVASEALLDATLSDDPEMAFRAAEVLRKVELRITPDTSEEVRALVRSFQDATIRGKAELLQNLKNQRAYYQSLKLFSMEPPEVREKLSGGMRGVGIIGARQAILKDDMEEAFELLRLSCTGGSHGDLMALASLYQSTGKIDEQLAQPDTPRNISEAVWKSLLLRAKGDLDGAIAHAEEHGQERILAGLKILKGDPTMWLRHNGWGEKSRQAPPAYVEIALKRWNGERVGKVDLEPLYNSVESGDDERRGGALSALAALGEFDVVEQIQASEEAVSAFVYHLAKDEVVDALAAIGLDTREPNYAAWVSKRFELLQDGGAEGSHALELVMLAGFMERRGLHRELESAFSKPMEQYQQKDEDGFLDFLSMIFGSANAAATLGLDQAAAWAGGDAARWDRIFEMALGNQALVDEWLGWIREIKPGMDQPETLEVMLTLFGKNYRPGDLRRQWLETVWGVIHKTEDAELKVNHLKRLISLAIRQQDVVNAVKAWDLLDEETQKSEKWSSMDRYLSAMGRWQEVAEIIESDAQVTRSLNPEIHAYYAAVLRRIGLEEKAGVYGTLAEKLNLGQVPSAIRIGSDYAFCGDSERASEWYRRAALQADFSDIMFLFAIDRHAQDSLNLGNWGLAAACHEVASHHRASRAYEVGALTDIAKSRLNADLSHAMSILSQRRAEALALLKNLHEKFQTDATLADHFFPALKRAGLNAQLNEWFAESWGRLVAVIERYPECHNSRNSAAWLASRAELKLQEAEDYLERALEMAPEQPAYLDTMAELNFAQGDFKSAIQWSDQAVRHSPFEEMIRMQNSRFKNPN